VVQDSKIRNIRRKSIGLNCSKDDTHKGWEKSGKPQVFIFHVFIAPVRRRSHGCGIMLGTNALSLAMGKG